MCRKANHKKIYSKRDASANWKLKDIARYFSDLLSPGLLLIPWARLQSYDDGLQVMQGQVDGLGLTQLLAVHPCLSHSL